MELQISYRLLGTISIKMIKFAAINHILYKYEQ
jgi:hypothetical protein